jgi:UDP-N-acetylglucosamine--N-acetylmuramyl-(pentapeptide) pyrophosphoryl-undecaprenol N-acetylglucosamine transferase
MFSKVGALFTAVRSAFLARSLVRRTKTRVVVGTGGYASAPAVLGGRLAGRPVLLLEPNAEVGVANRWLSRLASEAVVAHEVAAQDLRCPAHTTGVPVRAEFFEGNEELPPGPPWRLLVLGGSQGAQRLNEALPKALAYLKKEGISLVVTHQAGQRNQETTEAVYRAMDLSAARGGPVQVSVVPFLADMAGAMAAHHLVISRAGAITLAEICAAGRPAFLVPLTLAAGHQLGNALRLAEAGAAEVLPEESTAKDLARLLRDLLAQPERLRAMATAAKKLACPNAAERIADRVEHLANEIDAGGHA